MTNARGRGGRTPARRVMWTRSVSSSRQARRRDDVVGLPAHAGLDDQPAGGELEVVAGGAHQRRDRLAVQAEDERRLDGQVVGRAGGLGAGRHADDRPPRAGHRHAIEGTAARPLGCARARYPGGRTQRAGCGRGRRDRRADPHRRPGTDRGARRRGGLPRRPALARPLPAQAAAAVHARRRDRRGGALGARGIRLRRGDRVAALPWFSGFAEYAVAAPDMVFALPDNVDFAAGRRRCRSTTSPRTSRWPTAPGCSPARPSWCTARPAAWAPPRSSSPAPWSATVIAVASTDEKAELARSAGAQHTVAADGFLAAVKELTDGARRRRRRRPGRRRPVHRLAAQPRPRGPTAGDRLRRRRHSRPSRSTGCC